MRSSERTLASGEPPGLLRHLAGRVPPRLDLPTLGALVGDPLPTLRLRGRTGDR